MDNRLPRPAVLGRSGAPGYRVLILAEAASTIGSRLTTFLLSIWAWKTYGEASAIASTLAAFYIPRLIIGPIAGVYIDRWNWKRIIVFTNILGAVSILVLSWIYNNEMLTMAHVWVLGFAQAITDMFRVPTLNAAAKVMISPSDMPRIIALRELIRPVSQVSSAVLSGLLIGFFPFVSLLYFDCATFVLAAVATWVVTIPDPERRVLRMQPGSMLRFWTDLLAGFKFIAGRRGLLLCAFGYALFNVCGGPFLTSLLLPMAGDVWSRQDFSRLLLNLMGPLGDQAQTLPAQIVAIFNLMLFVGILCGGTICSIWGLPKLNSATIVASGVIVAGVCQALLGSSEMAIAMVAILVMGLTSPCLTIPINTIFTNSTPKELQGRVNSAYQFLSQLSYPVGLLLVGLGSQALSPSLLLIVSGVALGTSGLLWLLSPALQALDDQAPTTEAGV